MQSSQQIIGVNNRLGNPAVASMQGTTRAIFDSLPASITGGATYRFFENVQSRPYPASNLNTNRFEVGEALAIESIALLLSFTAISTAQTSVLYPIDQIVGAGVPRPQLLVNIYIGNQRVVKDLDFIGLLSPIGTTNIIEQKSVVYLETPIVIPPQIEFFVEIIASNSFLLTGETVNPFITCVLQGTGTLLNPKSNF
jgi:hypothetical protein